MSATFTHTLKDEITPALREAMALLGDAAGLNKRLGRECALQLRRHFQERETDGPRNRFGAPSSHFWADVRESVGEARVTADGAEVPIAHPAIAQKVFGGTIAKAAKKLAIPARTEAYHKSPRLFSDLRVIPFRSGATALVKDAVKLERGQRGIGRKRDAGMVFYWLKDEVHQAADPRALPDDAALSAALLARLQKIIARHKPNAS